jgi:hypothetical protein
MEHQIFPVMNNMEFVELMQKYSVACAKVEKTTEGTDEEETALEGMEEALRNMAEFIEAYRSRGVRVIIEV